MKKGKIPPMDSLFRTLVTIPPAIREIGVGDRNVFLGSCFAEHIGELFRSARLNVVVNPMGTLFCPTSIAKVLDGCDVTSAVKGTAGWHTWLSDTSFSFDSREECLREVNTALGGLQQALLQADNLFLTLGTSRAYRLRETNEIVVNCHKHPQQEFIEEEQRVEEMADLLGRVLERLHGQNPKLRVTFTVSPFRYAKYGFHESQLSKARLLLVADSLQRAHPDWIQYFPAYELVLDELRDYRFYAEDMLHVSTETVRYIGHRLQEWMSEELLAYLQRWKPLGQALTHRPFQQDSAAYQEFCRQTNTKLEQLQHDYPMLRIEDRL